MTVTRISRGQFYSACETLKKHKALFLDARPTYQDAAKTMSKILGFKISPNVMAEIQEVAGITWVPKRSTGNRVHPSDAVRALASALHRLYVTLGEEVPWGLKKVHQQYLVDRQGEPESEPKTEFANTPTPQPAPPTDPMPIVTNNGKPPAPQLIKR